MTIIPYLYEKDYSEIERQVTNLKSNFKWMQVGVSDATVNPEKTFELELLSRLEATESCLWDIRLEVREPIKWVEKSVFVNASRVTANISDKKERYEFVTRVRDKGLDAGLEFELDDQIDEIPGDCNIITMSLDNKIVENEELLNKIDKIRKAGEDFYLAARGIVDLAMINRLELAGVNVVYLDKLSFLSYVAKNK